MFYAVGSSSTPYVGHPGCWGSPRLSADKPFSGPCGDDNVCMTQHPFQARGVLGRTALGKGRCNQDVFEILYGEVWFQGVGNRQGGCPRICWKGKPVAVCEHRFRFGVSDVPVSPLLGKQ